MIGLSMSLVRGGGVPADFALEFNGSDEYLQIALPSDVASFNPATTNGGWSITGAATINSNVTTELGSAICIRINTTNVSAGIIKLAFLTVGKKYKLKIRYKSTVEVKFGNLESSSRYFTVGATTQWNTIERTINCVEDGNLRITSNTVSAGTILIESVTITEDWKLDLNESYELIKHSMNRDFEQTLGAELNSGTVTIGKKYIVTAGTVEGNAVGTEFLAVTNATTLDASNKVREIPNLVSNGTFTGNANGWTLGTGWAYGTNAIDKTAGSASAAFTPMSGISGKRYRLAFQVSNYSAGSVYALGYGNQISPARTADGVYSVDFTAGSANTNYGVYADAIFAGTVDNIHIYELPDYTSTGNHTANYSLLDKYAGTGSLLISASGAGSSGSNYVSLPSTQIDTLVSGNKYTLEGFAKVDPASLSYTNNATLSNDGSSSLGGWTATRGTASIESGSIKFTGDSNMGNPKGIQFNNGAIAGKTYRVRFKAWSATCTASIRWIARSDLSQNQATATEPAVVISSPALTTTSQNYEYYAKCVTTGHFSLGWTGENVPDGSVIYYDDIVIDEVTPITLTANLGSKSVTSSALSIVAGTFTKYVLNFEASESEVGQDLKMYLSGVGNVFVDKLSLTQAYDVTILVKNKGNRTDSIVRPFVYTGAFSDNNVGWSIWSFNGNINGAISPDVGNRVLQTVAITNSDIDNTRLVINRTDKTTLYANSTNSVGGTNSDVGKVIIARAFQIAKSSTSQYLTGQISHIQIIRFENISQSTFNSALTGLQYPTGGGAEEVLRLTFQNGSSITECLKDYSPKGHTVSGVNVDITNRKRVTA